MIADRVPLIDCSTCQKSIPGEREDSNCEDADLVSAAARPTRHHWCQLSRVGITSQQERGGDDALHLILQAQRE